MKLTKAQRRELRQMVDTGFIELGVRFGRSQSNRPRWALVEAGLAEFGFGPKDSFLQTQGFSPTPAGRSILDGGREP